MKPAKTLFTCLMAAALFIFSCGNSVKEDNATTETCFSVTNFDIVYQYIDVQIKKNNTSFYKYENYQIYLNDTTEISFKKDGYTLSKVIKGKGVVPLAKRKQDNNNVLKKTNGIFCEILLSAAQADTSKYVLTIKQGKYEKADNQTYLLVSTTLTNNTNDTLKYLSMLCSWWDFYYVDNDRIEVYKGVCKKNFEIMLTLLPHKSVDREIKLVIGQTTGTSKLKFRIGINLLKVKNEKIDEWKELRNTKNIIWSNVIETE